MKKIAASLNDTHLKYENTETNKSIFKQFIGYCLENDIQHCFHFGDIFDSRKAMPLDIAKVFENILDMFHESGLRLVAIKGNHDCMDYEGEDSYLDLFKHHPAFNIIRDNGFVRISDKINLHLIPFFKESTTYRNYLEKAATEKGKLNYLGTHVAIDGAMNNDGTKVSDILPASLFDKFDKVIVAHYHNEYWINDKIWYCGSGFQHNYGEDSNKGLVVYYEDGSMEKVQLKFPEYRKYSIDISNLEESEILELSKEKEEGHNIKIEITGDIAKVKSFDKSKLKDLGIEVSDNSTSEKIDVNDAKVKFDSKDIIGKFDEFCKDIKADNIEYGMEKIKLI